jgi:hypothetical protein
LPKKIDIISLWRTIDKDTNKTLCLGYAFKEYDPQTKKYNTLSKEKIS